MPAAAIGFVALAIWPAFVPGSSVRWGHWMTLALLAVLAWFALALFAGKLEGLSERALAGAEALTPIVIVVASRRRKGAEGLPEGDRTTAADPYAH